MGTLVITTGVAKYKDKILLLKRAPDQKLSPNEWEFISGSFDTGENAEQIVLRELKEEAGLEGKIIKTGGSFEFIEKETRWITLPYLVEVSNNEVLLSSEHSEFQWIDKSEIKKYDSENGDNYLETILSRLT